MLEYLLKIGISIALAFQQIVLKKYELVNHKTADPSKIKALISCGVPWDSQGKLNWYQLKTFKAEDFKTLPYPGNNVIVVSNHGLKTEGKNSRKGEFWKEMPDIN